MRHSKANAIRRRSTVEMDIAILQALSGTNLKLTHIMYRANVNAIILKEKIIALEEKGFIVSYKLHKEHLNHKGKDRMLYGLTSEGLEVLKSYLSVYNSLGCIKYER